MTGHHTPVTAFAPAERAPREQLTIEHRTVAERLVKEVFDASVSPTAVLNAQRQIVLCNRALLAITEGADPADALGARPGEWLRCVHAGTAPGGCGTTEFCRTCGAVLAILEGQQGRPATRECRLQRQRGGIEEPLDLRVTVSPLPLFDRFTVCSIEDVSHEKRRRALERAFFHDVLDTAFTLQTQVQVLSALPLAGQATHLVDRIRREALQLVSELDGQRLLLAAERRDLAVNPTVIPTGAILRSIRDQWQNHPVAEGKQLVCARADDVPLRADVTLLNRVLGNMVKNALEASTSGATVTIECVRVGRHVEFSAHNARPLDGDEQRQMFQRSFSTKGPGRGLGTYSMKLLTERYLGGQVRFSSSPDEGTTFVVSVPAGI